jgi:hypothetical protein
VGDCLGEEDGVDATGRRPRNDVHDDAGAHPVAGCQVVQELPVDMLAAGGSNASLESSLP